MNVVGTMEGVVKRLGVDPIFTLMAWVRSFISKPHYLQCFDRCV